MLNAVQFEKNNRILLRKVNFAFMFLNPRLDCSYGVLNFLSKFEPRSYKVVLIQRKT